MSITVRELIKTGTISSKDATIAGSVAAGLIVLLVLYIAVVDTGQRARRERLNESIAAKVNELEAAKELAEREGEIAYPENVTPAGPRISGSRGSGRRESQRYQEA